MVNQRECSFSFAARWAAKHARSNLPCLFITFTPTPSSNIYYCYCLSYCLYMMWACLGQHQNRSECVSVCLYMLCIEDQNVYFTSMVRTSSEMRTFWVVLTTSDVSQPSNNCYYWMTKIFLCMLLAAAASSVLLPLKIIHIQLIALSIVAPLHTGLCIICRLQVITYVYMWCEAG